MVRLGGVLISTYNNYSIRDERMSEVTRSEMQTSPPKDFLESAARFYAGSVATGVVGTEFLNIAPQKALPISVVVGLAWAIKNYRSQ